MRKWTAAKKAFAIWKHLVYTSGNSFDGSQFSVPSEKKWNFDFEQVKTRFKIIAQSKTKILVFPPDLRSQFPSFENKPG